mmetsp:Transcript_18400/g.52751  ORF Transcript_18400/g.52751 Transcript_18400/m.52751 type:complete len:264 (+) Transcript_18400:2995-3786(+)
MDLLPRAGASRADIRNREADPTPPSGRPLLPWPPRTSCASGAERRNGRERRQLRMVRMTKDPMPTATNHGSLTVLPARLGREVSQQILSPWEEGRTGPRIRPAISRTAHIGRIGRQNLAAGRIDRMPQSVVAILGTLTNLTDRLALRCLTCRNRVAPSPTISFVSRCSWLWSVRRRVEAMAIGRSALVGPRPAVAIPRAGPSPYRRGPRLPSWPRLASWASFSPIRQIPREQLFPEYARRLSSPIRSALEIASSLSMAKMLAG